MKKITVKITFLGTGTSQGVPMLLSDEPVNLSKNNKDKRLRSSVLISWGTVNYLIDCGPDFRYQMLRADVKRLDGIFFSHEHSDHIAGLDDIRPFCYQIGPMPIYAQQRVMTALEKRYDYIFEKENRYPGAAQVLEHIIDTSSLILNGMQIVPIAVQHGNLDIRGYRFGDVAYLTDVKNVAETEIEKLKKLDVLVVSALRIDPHPTHFNLEEALAFIAKIQPQKAYLTHISHRLGFHDEVSKQLPSNVFLSYDGLEVSN
ncbi:MBL fold metallo-hydrolase [uncultured Polaribacter sp.]|uniref:MBL fold metallo-hydrolase n=1 Tax=uncultured Polaribacter sp. TaxID=174711 RepID=UPI00263485F5|nr:MBL fold metallo-hydrolase [uncultured Polaribacter sp.]